MTTDDFIAYVDVDLKAIIPGFLENRQQDVKQLQLAAKQNNTKMLGEISHNLKGIGANYGFEEITQLGIAMEKFLQVNDMENVNSSIECLVHYLANVKILYKKID